MTYKEGQTVLYRPLNTVATIRRVNNRPEVAESQRNYLVLVNGYLVTVYEDQADEFLTPAPAKPKPPLQDVKQATPVTIQDVKTSGFKWPWKK